jgi:hypothetical protein
VLSIRRTFHYRRIKLLSKLSNFWKVRDLEKLNKIIEATQKIKLSENQSRNKFLGILQLKWNISRTRKFRKALKDVSAINHVICRRKTCQNYWIETFEKYLPSKNKLVRFLQYLQKRINLAMFYAILTIVFPFPNWCHKWSTLVTNKTCLDLVIMTIR